MLTKVNQHKNIPYRTCAHIHTELFNNYVFYFDLFNDNHLTIPYDAHKCILSGHHKNFDECGEYLKFTIEKLMALNYIEPDLTKIQVGEASVYIPHKAWKPAIQYEKEDLQCILSNEYLNPTFCFESVNKHSDERAYEYLCECNSLRVAMQAYGIELPLLWMNCGLFVFDVDFADSGEFATSFSRPMLDTNIIPILGEEKNDLDWDIIDAHLEKKLPVLCSVDIYHMAYESNIYYHTRHGAHRIILLEKRCDSYLILDWFHPGYFFGEMSKKELEVARTSNNEKDYESAFNGYPILAAYKLLHLDRFPLNLDKLQYVKNTLYGSVKALLHSNGVIAFLNETCLNTPEWLGTPNHAAYNKAMESFFFFGLELRILKLYYEEILKSEVCIELDFQGLLECIVRIEDSVDSLKYKLIVALRKSKTINDDEWSVLVEVIISRLSEYCELIIRNLK